MRNDFPPFHATSRKDYSELERRSLNGSAADRIAVAKIILNSGHIHTDCRALDNCFEMGDGDRIMRALKRAAKAHPEENEGLAEWLRHTCSPS